MTKISGSESFSQRHGSADPDPPRNVMDPEHWFLDMVCQHVGSIHSVYVREDVPRKDQHSFPDQVQTHGDDDVPQRDNHTCKHLHLVITCQG
jgi:hypothetical protein